MCYSFVVLVNPDNDSAEAVGEALIFKNHAFSSELQGVVCIRCVRSVSAQEPSISSEDMFLAEGNADCTLWLQSTGFIGEPSQQLQLCLTKCAGGPCSLES